MRDYRPMIQISTMKRERGTGGRKTFEARKIAVFQLINAYLTVEDSCDNDFGFFTFDFSTVDHTEEDVRYSLKNWLRQRKEIAFRPGDFNLHKSEKTDDGEIEYSQSIHEYDEEKVLTVKYTKDCPNEILSFIDDYVEQILFSKTEMVVA